MSEQRPLKNYWNIHSLYLAVVLSPLWWSSDMPFSFLFFLTGRWSVAELIDAVYDRVGDRNVWHLVDDVFFYQLEEREEVEEIL
jgi:hypothetical protein